MRKFDLLPNAAFSLGLDLGCGPGENIPELVRIAKAAVALDIDSEAIRRAGSKWADRRVHFLQGDIGRLPLRDRCADLVVLSEVLEHCRDEPQVISEIARVLQPGGFLLLTTPHRGLFQALDPLNFGYYFPRVYFWSGLAAKRRRKGENLVHRHYRLSQLVALLKGFEITRVHRGGLLLHPLTSWIDATVVKFFPGRVPEGWRERLYRIAAWEVAVPFGVLAYDLWISARKS